MISLGQGVGAKVESKIKESRKKGTWILLENCHLAESWMNDLERICYENIESHCHDDFRLWLTTKETGIFAIDVL